MTDISAIKLYATQEHACSYLKDRSATTIFVDPALKIDAHVYSELSDFGFRRSGRHVYRPNCRSCHACVPVRVPVAGFQASRSQKRCLRVNQDIQVVLAEHIDTQEHYQLYANYIAARHSDGDMFPPSKEQYRDFLSAEWGVTRFLEFRLDDKLLGVAVSDQLDQGLSAIYTFFDPDVDDRSLGVFAVLHQIQRAADLGLTYLYLGYWINDCVKMRYKTQYRPLEILLDGQWQSLT
jgi:leucyl-tRNA---protein transferase